MVAFQENITGNGLFHKNFKKLQKTAAPEGFSSVTAVAYQNYI